MINKYKNFIWDYDGTLFDSYPFFAKNLMEILQSEGIDLTKTYDEYYADMKISTRFALKDYSDAPKLNKLFWENYNQHYKDLPEIKPCDGLQAVLEEIKLKGGDSFVYTLSGDHVANNIKNYGLDIYFKDYITSDSTFPPKPDPQSLLYLIEKHSLNPAETIVVGDREIDLVAARNAGLDGCLYDEGNYYPAFDPTYRIQSLYEIINK